MVTNITKQTHYPPLPIVNFEKKYMFFWNAKCGSVLTSLMFLEDCGFRCDQYISEFRNTHPGHAYELTHPNHIDECRTLYNLNIGINNRSYKRSARKKKFAKFKLVRSPYTRALSGFLMLLRNYESNDADPTGFLSFACQRNSISSPLRLSFKSFCLSLKYIDLNNTDPHFRLQKHPLEISKKMTLDRVIKLENLEKDIAKLNRDFNLNLNYSKYKNKKYEHHATEKFSNSKVEDIASVSYGDYSHLDFDKKSFYNAEMREIVEALYLRDFTAYNYDFKV